MRRCLLVVLAVLCAVPGAAHAASAGSTLLVDRPDGLGALPSDGLNDAGVDPDAAVSDDGRYVLFSSASDGLLPAGADATRLHLFIRDRTTNEIRLVDARQDGTPANGAAGDGALSGDGKHVAFVSSASNLTNDAGVGDGLYTNNVFVKDLTTGAVKLVSRTVAGAPENNSSPFAGSPRPAISADGNRIAWQTGTPLDTNDINSNTDVYLRNVDVGTTTLITREGGYGSAAVGGSQPAVSADGALVAFITNAKLDADDNNGLTDVYYRSYQSGAGSTLVSENTIGNAGSGGSASQPSFGGTTGGLRIAFLSTQTDLVAGDTNGKQDVFIRSAGGTTTTLISRPSGTTTLSDGFAGDPAFSANGTHVAFTSTAGNLVSGAPSGVSRVYVRSLNTAGTVLASQSTPGTAAAGEAPSLTADGGTVIFASADDALPAASPDFAAVFARTTGGGGSTTLVSDGAGAAGSISSASVAETQVVSDDGRFVVFVSASDALAGGDDDAKPHAFLRDMTSGAVRGLDKDLPGPATQQVTQANISPDGSAVALLVSDSGKSSSFKDSKLYRLDIASGRLDVVNRADGADGTVFPSFGDERAVLSADGNRIAFRTDAALDPAHDANGDSDVYVRDVRSGTSTLVSRPSGAATNTAGGFYVQGISADGNRILFSSFSTALSDNPDGHLELYVRDLAAGTTTLASRADGATGAVTATSLPLYEGSLSADGNRVAFSSGATNLGAGDPQGHTQIYVRDLAAGTTRMVSRVGTDGAPGDGASTKPLITSNGRRVLFSTQATNLGAGSPSSATVQHDLESGANVLVARANGVDGAPVAAGRAVPNGDGGCVVFAASGARTSDPDYQSSDFRHVYERSIDGTCPPSAPVAVAPTPTPTASVTPVPTVTPAPPARDRTKPVISKLKITRKRISFTLSEKAKVKVTIKRGKKRLVGISKTLKKGKVTVTLSKKVRRKLHKRGRYTFRLVATDAARNVSKAKTAKLRVRKR